METCLHFRGAALNARETGIWREKNITFFIYLLTRTLGHVLYLQANNAL
jgi:hypothetical protein